MSRLAFLGLVVVSAAACGGAAAGSAPSSDVAASVDATEVGARDVTPDVPSDEGVVDLGPVARWGTVSLVETHPEGPPVQQIVNAVFATSTLYGTPVATFGECGYYELPTRDALVAGAVTFTRGDAGYALAPEPVAPGISYPTERLPDGLNLFVPGATVTATAPGASFPGFSLAVTAPAPFEGFVAPANFSRSVDRTLTWTPGSGDRIRIELNGFDTTSHLLTCDTADDGSFVVPHEGVARFPAGVSAAYLILWRSNIRTARQGDALIEFNVAAATLHTRPIAP